MSTGILQYYQEEMRYLQEAGELFAQSHPDEASLLNLGSLTDRDPYVERLFEGFAFLTARIRERLDDELPQYTEGLLNLLWPHLLRPVPSLSVLEFRPIAGLVSTSTTIARGAEVRSAPVGDDGTVCRFSTTQEVRLQPFQLVSAELGWPRSDCSTMTLRFRMGKGSEFARLSPSPLRMYLHADRALASLLHLHLTRHVTQIQLRASDSATVTELTGQQWITPGGFGEPDGVGDDALLPYSPHTFHGFRLLQEYLAFRQKFWFVDLLGLEQLQATPKMTSFDVEIRFDRALPQGKQIKAEQIRLFCTPVVNLFSQDANPIRVDHRSSEYRVIGDLEQPRGVEVYDVLRVTGEEDGTRRRHTYQPYLATGREPTRERWFTTTQRTRADGRRDTLLTLGGADAAALRPETVSLEVRCTNGSLPQERLREGMIRELGPNVPRVATVEMLVQPTGILRAPVQNQRELYWRLISHLSLGHRSLGSRDGLADLLTLYDWSDDAANRRRIAGIRSVTTRPREMVHRRACIRGSETELEIGEEHFSDEGDVCLFGLVLSHVLRAYTTINSFAHLAIVQVPSRSRYVWNAHRGAQAVL
ncbi:MAG: type VI secretion system baseplate subunit TssF [Gemmatimonadaceae bacterium]